MSLWRRVRGEIAGAWRSVGYDLGRRPAEPPAGGPDVTSTGMGTFPGSLVDRPVSSPEIDARPPRRFVAVTAFCMLALLGAGGSYFAATTVFAEEPPPAPPGSAAVAAPGPAGFATSEDQGLGSGPGTARRPRTTPPAVPPPARPAGAPVTVVQPDGTVTTVVPRATTNPPVTRPSDPECDCTPPVPTPTVPSSTPADSGSPSPSESSGSPSADPSESGEPDPSVSPSDGAEPSPAGDGPRRDSDRRHRRWHHQ